MQKYSWKSRVEIPLGDRINIVSENLLRAFARIDPAITYERFRDEVIQPLMISGYTGDELVTQALAHADDPRLSNVDRRIIEISLAYTAQAQWALNSGDQLLASSHLIEAFFWCGVAQGSKALHEAEMATVKQTKSDLVRPAADARNASLAKTTEMALKIERENRPVNGWPSRRQAAKKIVPILLKTKITGGHQLKPDQAETTVGKWLKNMPDAAEAFPKAKKKD